MQTRQTNNSENSNRAFDKAILEGRLSHAHFDNSPTSNWAGNYMFMGASVKTGKDLFKNIHTREYLA